MPLHYNFIKPPRELSCFVESFGMFSLGPGKAKEVVVIPDGEIDLFLHKTEGGPFRILLTGLETAPKQRCIAPGTLFFDINFKPLAVEYLLNVSIADVVNSARYLPDNFWGFNSSDLADFEAFCKKASDKMMGLLPKKVDERKRQLFDLIYLSNGEVKIAELADEIGWSPRQINRYFSSRFGLSLKEYCNILRFRASLAHIANGQLSPELNFADQNHFIKEIKKFSGLPPKELFKNANDRFVLLSVLKQQ